jgi:hypothetical protein
MQHISRIGLDIAKRRFELWRKVGDGVNQAAFLIFGAASIPSLNMTP